ncbi:hypothetical protein [Marinomonas communis]|uniref:GIY-YIG domain-containing protein n=1 Tax=Marinomonas communis TaxID=28254 RepID=A0A4R6XB16_9GAMM|nr:hypothetical protein [Marinomonas communis]TDR14063.1 hypothetical protein C8D85_1596 [Marinomonas communis]
MSKECETIHKLARSLKRHTFPFDDSEIPSNGIYILFEKDEKGHGGDRIVRVGTHTGDNQLRPRLKQHFLNENKDRSIFRKNIGRSLLKQANDPFLEYWELDLTTRKSKEKYAHLIDFEYQKVIESRVSQYIQGAFSFCVFEVNDKKKRLEIESKIISTVSWCERCTPSNNWIGSFSPKEKIAKSGLWLVNELYKTPFDASGIQCFSKLVDG